MSGAIGQATELLRSSGRVLVWSVLAVLANAVSGVLSARALTVADKGVLAMVLTIGGLLWVATSLGTNVALRVRYPGGTGTLTLRDYGRVSCELLIVQAGCAVLLFGAARLWLSEVPVSPFFLGLVLALSLTTFVSSQLLDALHAISRSAEATRTDAAGAATTAVCVLAAALGWEAGRGVAVLVACYVAGYLVRIAVAVQRLVALDPRHGAPGSRAGRAELIQAGLPFLGFNVGQVVAFRADRYLLGLLSTPAAAGLYSVATTPAELLRLPVTALGQILMQRTAATGTTLSAVRRACLLTAVITVPPAVLLFATADVAVEWVFGPRYAAAGGVLRVMVVSEVAVALFLVLSRIAAGAGLARSTGVATVAGAVTGVGALCLLAPTHGAVGAAWASLAGYVVMATFILSPLVRHARRRSTCAPEG